jgi:hypothetical protein
MGEPSTMVHGTFTPLSHQSLLADETEARRLLGIFTPEPVAAFGEAGADAYQAAYETHQSAPQAAFIAECVSLGLSPALAKRLHRRSALAAFKFEREQRQEDRDRARAASLLTP